MLVAGAVLGFTACKEDDVLGKARNHLPNTHIQAGRYPTEAHLVALEIEQVVCAKLITGDWAPASILEQTHAVRARQNRGRHAEEMRISKPACTIPQCVL